MYKKILLPYDFGNSFTNIPEQLKKLTGNDPEAEIIIFNIIPENELANSVRFENKHLEALIEEKEEFLKPFTDQLDDYGLNYKTHFKTGRIIQELLYEINDNDYDIVVMSNRRSKREIKHVLGHVTHKVAKRVNTPVLIVK